MMGDKLLILMIIVFITLIYYKNQMNDKMFLGGIIAVIILLILSKYNNIEGFDTTPTSSNADESTALPGSEVRYGDIICLWAQTPNAFLRFNGNIIDTGARLTQPEAIPRVGWTGEFMVIEDPNESAIGLNNNSNPIKYGNQISLRSTYNTGYVAVNPDSNNTNVISSTTRNQYTQLQFIATQLSGKAGQIVRYGDQLYLKTNKGNNTGTTGTTGTSGTFLSASTGPTISNLTTQDNNALFTICDRYGQGGLQDWARRGTAEQISIYNSTYPPNNAIDGDQISFNHTQQAQNAWWRVILPRDIYITKIQIYNRYDCCQDRLQNFNVDIMDVTGNIIIATKTFQSGGDGKTPVIWPNINRIGRIVRVQLNGNNYLHMGTVNVYGTPIQYSLLLEKPLSADVLNVIRTFSSTAPTTDTTNVITIDSVDMPFNNQSKSVTITAFVKLLKTNTSETSLIHKGSSNGERSPAITVLPNSSQLRFYYGTAQSSSQSFDLVENLPLNQWFHVCYSLFGGINSLTGWNLIKLNAKLTTPPYQQCCYLINPIIKKYYYVPASSSPSIVTNNDANLIDPIMLQGLKYMGQLDPKLANPMAFVYINGIMKSTIQLTATPQLNTSPLNIGKSPNLTMSSSDFAIDQIKYFNHQLTVKEIVRLSQSPLQTITKTLVIQSPDTTILSKFEDNQLPHIENDFTVNFWLLTNRPPNGTGLWDQIFLKGIQSADRAPGMWFHPNSNNLHMPIKTKNKAFPWGEGIIQSNFVFRPNEWHHVGLTLNDKVQTLYIDGKQSDQFTLSDSAVFMVSPLTIGGYTGQIKNFQFSNFAMTQNQIINSMGPNPDSQYDKTIQKIWKDTGCLTDIRQNENNMLPQWITYLKNDQKSRVEGDIQGIKKKADGGDKKQQELCYGKFTTGMISKLAEKDNLIKYALEKQKEHKKCLPIAPFECNNKNINDFDIRTHKDFNKFTLSSRIKKCSTSDATGANGSPTDLTKNADYIKMQKELQDAQLMVTKLQTLQQELQKNNDTLNQTIKNTSTNSQLTQAQLMQYPAFQELQAKYDAQQKNLQQVNATLQSQQQSVSNMQNNINTTDPSKNPQCAKLFSENEYYRKLAQSNLSQNLDLSQLENNPLFMKTLNELRLDAMKPQQCTSDQILNSKEYKDLKNKTDTFTTQLAQASLLSQQAVSELSETKKAVTEILGSLNNIDPSSIQTMLSQGVNHPDTQQFIQQANQQANQSQCGPGSYRIEDHPEYNKFANEMKKMGCANIPIEQHPQYNALIQSLETGQPLPSQIPLSHLQPSQQQPNQQPLNQQQLTGSSLPGQSLPGYPLPSQQTLPTQKVPSLNKTNLTPLQQWWESYNK